MSRFAYPLNPFDPDLPLCIFGIGREDDQPPVIRKNGFPFPQPGKEPWKLTKNPFL